MSEKIIEYIKKTGPIVPMDLANELNVTSIIASAHLSDLVSKKIVKISNLKVGSSPLYYLPEQKNKLEEFTKSLHEREKEAFNLLKEKQVVRESNLSPVLRVSMKAIKDFAVPLEVSFKDSKEIFWKFHRLTNEEAGKMIKEMLAPKKEEVEVKKEEPKEEKKVEFKEEKVKEKKPEVKEEFKEEEPKKKEEVKEENKEQEVEEKKIDEKKEVKEKQKKISKKIDSNDKLLNKVNDLLTEKDISIINYEILRKNSEIDLELEVPTNIGDLTFYCKAKKKKRLNESDLDSVFVGGELKKLPKILISPGKLTKSAKEKIDKNYNITFLKL